MNGSPFWIMSAIVLPLTFFMAFGRLRMAKGGIVSLNILKNDASKT